MNSISTDNFPSGDISIYNYLPVKCILYITRKVLFRSAEFSKKSENNYDINIGDEYDCDYAYDCNVDDEDDEEARVDNGDEQDKEIYEDYYTTITILY
ncbi:Hypothetical predicted protein [Octopus vulgaris]|uniref:Uncharacterized protein n=1 Tax=Octopus vulgaris TaxID=6645 RepID=A0AA36F4Z4_OCTVU|nr:Hypothetical predicted protein [Octopus vulgaris]